MNHIYFHDFTLIAYVCHACKTCDSSLLCTSCEPKNGTNYFLHSDTKECVVVCPNDLTPNITTFVCEFVCDKNCLTCLTHIKNCVSCGKDSMNQDMFLVEDHPVSGRASCVVVCPSKTFYNYTSLKCIACHASCSVCFGILAR